MIESFSNDYFKNLTQLKLNVDDQKFMNIDSKINQNLNSKNM